jgi:hypothetical protein
MPALWITHASTYVVGLKQGGAFSKTFIADRKVWAIVVMMKGHY